MCVCVCVSSPENKDGIRRMNPLERFLQTFWNEITFAHLSEAQFNGPFASVNGDFMIGCCKTFSVLATSESRGHRAPKFMNNFISLACINIICVCVCVCRLVIISSGKKQITNINLMCCFAFINIFYLAMNGRVIKKKATHHIEFGFCTSMEIWISSGLSSSMETYKMATYWLNIHMIEM